ncbi:MAG TPA: hypothetical protein VL633_13535 [Bacteroidota bacterium]|jgi:tRNA1(Val) A37 N6-methylase TrmN6|nr:hypothetical protein [Bacteroidota bacterium]
MNFKRVPRRLLFLFDQIPPTEEYDLIIVNPPFYKGDARDVAAHAWYSGSDPQYFRKLAPQARLHLGRHGKMIFVVSSEMDIEGATSIFRESQFEVSRICSRKVLFEIFYILQISHVP